MDNDTINVTQPYQPDIINTSLSLDLCEVLAVLNKHNHNGFNYWAYNPNLDIIAVNKPMNITYIYYYSMTCKEAELIAENYLRNEINGNKS